MIFIFWPQLVKNSRFKFKLSIEIWVSTQIFILIKFDIAFVCDSVFVFSSSSTNCLFWVFLSLLQTTNLHQRWFPLVFPCIQVWWGSVRAESSWQWKVCVGLLLFLLLLFSLVTSTKEVMFCPALFVCQQDCATSYRQIWLKFLG